MVNTHYVISEVSKNVGVEPHVLRHWEKKLSLQVKRNDTGHRYYTEENIKLLQCIKKLIAHGVTLNELRILVPEIQKVKAELEEKKRRIIVQKDTRKVKNGELIMTEEILVKVLEGNNSVLEKNICEAITDSIKKEMTHLLDAKDRLEEDRYKKLDALIRQQQAHRKESARRSTILNWGRG